VLLEPSAVCLQARWQPISASTRLRSAKIRRSTSTAIADLKVVVAAATVVRLRHLEAFMEAQKKGADITATITASIRILEGSKAAIATAAAITMAVVVAAAMAAGEATTAIEVDFYAGRKRGLGRLW